MNTKKKRFAPKKRLIKHFLALTLAGSLLLPGLVLIQPQEVEASVIVDMASGVIGKIRYTTTVAEIVVSLLTGSGASVTNTQWLNQLNNAYGVESALATATGTDGTLGAMYEAGLFSVDSAGHFVDQGLGNAIRSTSGYSSLGLEDLFTTTNADLELGAWQTADAATNIGEAASAGITLGTLGQAVGAVSMGVHLGVLANKVAEYWGKKMANAAPVTTADNIINNIPSGYRLSYNDFYRESNRTWYTSYKSYPNTCYSVRCDEKSAQRPYYVLNPSSNRLAVYYTDATGNWNTGYVSAHNFYNWLLAGTNTENYRNFGGFTSVTLQEFNDIINGSISPTVSPYSPDVIGPGGNMRTTDPNNPTNITSWPDLKPVDELQDQDTGIEPIPWNDYIDQTTIFNQNTTNNNTTIQQGDTYNNFVTQYITTPSTSETVETPDYNPTVPEQPTPNPKEELTSEVVQDNTDYMSTPGLKDVFPFSIPWDIAGLFNVFSTNNREAPVITFPIVSELFGIDEEITIDLSPYDDVASLFRLLELIAFGLGLAFVTRYLIGAGG